MFALALRAELPNTWEGITVLRKMIFTTVAAAAGLALLAGPAEARPDWANYWHKYPTAKQCEEERRLTEARGTRVSDRCDPDGGGSYQYWT